MNSIITLAVIAVCVLVVILTVWGMLSRYQRAAPDELLVVFGKSGKMKTEDGKTIVTPSKIIQGGGTFVWPIIQSSKKMSMKPLQIKVNVDGIDSQAIPMHLPVVLTTAISQDKLIQQNAATRFLSASPTEIERQISEILVGETRAIMATMLIEEINADRNTFLGKVRESLEQELTKVGYELTNINISEITDDADYIRNMGQKAATKAKANAEADIAEQRKQGNIKIANTQKEEQIAVSQAERDMQISVNQTKQEQEVKVAEINREKQIKLAEAEKERESGIALQEAEKIANIAKANADAESKKAEYEAMQTKNIAKADADAEAAQNEAEAQKQVRIAKARQEQEAETIKATQEKEAKAAEYESSKRQRKAEQEKRAGVAEQEAKIDVAKARAKAGQAEADALKVAETAKVEAQMAVAKTTQERQLEVNQAEAKAQEAKLNATKIVTAQKQKEEAIIYAEAEKKKAELEAEALKAKILREAEAEAERIRLAKNAEAEGTKKILMAEAEGKKASLLAEAEAEQQKALAPAMAFERMIQAAGSPEMAVQWKMVDQYKGIAEAQAHALEHINMGQVTVYGDTTTGASFAKSFVEKFAPALDMINTGVKGQFKDLFGIGNKDNQQIENKSEKENQDFENVK
jgi:flotillin